MDASEILRLVFPTDAEAARNNAASEAHLSPEQRFAAAERLFQLMVAALKSRGEPLYGPEDAASERDELARFLTLAHAKRAIHA